MPVDVYQSLGVRRVINAAATLTSIGGYTLPDDVVDAMASAASSCVDIRELHEKAGDAIASLTNNEAALELEEAIDNQTVAVLWVAGSHLPQQAALDLGQTVRIAHARGFP